jgi:serine/threonine protein kinase
VKRSDVTQVLSRSGRDVGAVVAGRYRLAAHIGSGGTSEVWRAYDESRDRPVTVKILRDPDDADARRHFLAEARRLETLDHPSIVPVLGIHEALGDTLIAFEHVEGDPLDRIADPAMAPRKIALLMIQIADAVEAFHAHGFVHLDLKPANILMGSDGRPRLLDFGIAEPIGHPPEITRGTPGFSPPELAAGGAASRASDVYGLAAIAKHLLGAHPTPRVSSVLRRGLEPDPAKRFGRPRSFVYGVALAVLIDEELAALHRATRRVRAFATDVRSRGAVRRALAFMKARPELSFRVAAVGLIAAGLLLQQVHGVDSGTANAGVMPTLVRPAFDVPPLGAYGAAFESQGAYPTASPNSTVEWTLALRNTGSAGWYRGVDGAQASLILDDGTVVAVQSTQYVGPGQVGWFTARFRAPSDSGPHSVRLRPVINGRGPLPDLGIYAVVTVK